MTPVAVVFHDPLGRFSVPAGYEHGLLMPGLCSVTYENRHITFRDESGREIGFHDMPDRETWWDKLTGPGTYVAPWHTEEPGCPYLTALAQTPGIGDMSRRWKESVVYYSGRAKHVGQIGKRQEFTLTYEDTAGPYESEWGSSYRHQFRSGVDKFIWWTGKQVSIMPEETRTVKATMKSHEDFRGQPINVITRVSPLKGEEPLTHEPSPDQQNSSGDE